MRTYTLSFVTKSDSTFGRGDGVAGFIDTEVQHDMHGIPFLGGRTLKGLLGEECANIIYSLKKMQENDFLDKEDFDSFTSAAKALFGVPGSTHDDKGSVHFSDAQLPLEIRNSIIKNNSINPQQILDALCSIRRQTAIDPLTGAAKDGSLRVIRVILRETPFEASLSFTRDPDDLELALLSACIKAFRRAGTDRNRGKGEIGEHVLRDEVDKDILNDYFEIFKERVASQKEGGIQ